MPFDYTRYDCSGLNSLIKQIMEMDHIKLSEEARAYKKCLEDMNEMRFTIHSTCKLDMLNAFQVTTFLNFKIRYLLFFI